MNRDEVRKLLGGYATGTLTPEEEQALFAAALEDQELFDAMAREQSLRDLLRDPAAKARLLAALDEPAPRWYERWRAWRPAAVLAMAAMAVVAVLIVRQGRPTMQVMEVAQVVAPAPMPMPMAPKPEEPKPAPAMRAARREPARAAAAAPRATPAESKPVMKEAAAAPPPPPPPAPAALAEAVEVPKAESAYQPMAGLQAGLRASLRDAEARRAPVPRPGQDARDLFYGNVPAQQTPDQPAAQQAEAQQGGPRQSERAKAATARGSLGAVSGYSAPANAPAASPRVVNPGVKYAVLRKSASGDFVEAAPGDLKAGDTVELRFETNDSGFLTVTASGDGGARPVFSRRVDRLAAYTTETLGPGETRLQVVFLRQVQAARAGVPETRANLTQQAAPERTTYVVGPPASRQVSFTIALDFR